MVVGASFIVFVMVFNLLFREVQRLVTLSFKLALEEEEEEELVVNLLPTPTQIAFSLLTNPRNFEVGTSLPLTPISEVGACL